MYQEPPASNYQYGSPPPANPGGFIGDKIVGILMIILSLCCVCVAGLAMGMGAIMEAASADPSTTEQQRQQMEQAVQQFEQVPGWIFSAMMLGSLIGLVGGIGVAMSRSWGLILGAVGYGIIAIGNFGAGVQGIIGGGFALLFVIYCGLRLGKAVGPPPR
jgi:hypothetical protein